MEFINSNPQFELNQHDPISSLCYLGKGRLASGCDISIIIWDMSTRLPIERLKSHTGTVSCFCFLENDLIVSGSYDRSIRIWNILEKEITASLKR